MSVSPSTPHAHEDVATVDRVHWIDGLDLFIRDEGSGSPVLLLHGVPFSHHVYRAVLQPLSARHRVLAVDIPGFGESGRPPAFAYDVVSYGDSMVALLERMGARPASVVGHGFGAAIALSMAVLHPGSVRRLVLVGGMVYPQRLPSWLRLAMRDGLVGAWVRKRVFTRDWLAGYLRERVFLDAGAVDDALVEYYWERISRLGGMEAIGRVLRTVAAMDPVAELPPRVSCPTLVVGGDGDRIVPPGIGRRLAEEIVGARFVEIASCGHSPQEEKPRQFLDAVLPFLAGER